MEVMGRMVNKVIMEIMDKQAKMVNFQLMLWI